MDKEMRFSGDKIRQFRNGRSWSQAELARHAGVRERQIIRWENEQNAPRLAGMLRIAAALGRPVSDFFADDDERQPSTDEEEAAALLRHAHDLEVRGDYAMADDLRASARRMAMRARRRVAA